MMKMRFLLSQLCALLFLSGCGEQGNTLREYVNFCQTRVSLPEQMIKIVNGRVDSINNYSPSLPVLVRYYGSKECTDCAFSHMRDNLKQLYLSKQEKTFDFIVIMAPPEDVREEVIARAVEMSLPLTIMVDDSYYLESQRGFPSSPSLHSFLLNLRGRPVFIGSPFRNSKTLTKFHRRLDALHTNQVK